MKESRQRARALRYHVNNIVRMAGMHPCPLIKRIIRIGRWQKDQAARPIVVEFANPRVRDTILAKAAEIKNLSQSTITIEPDCSQSWRCLNATSTEKPHPSRGQPVVRVSKILPVSVQTMPAEKVDNQQKKTGAEDYGKAKRKTGPETEGDDPRSPTAKNGEQPRA